MRNFPLTELREKLFGNTFERSKSGSSYKKILGFKVRLSDHYVSKVGGGSTNRGDIEIVLNPDDSFGISLNNREVDVLLYDWLEKESNDTQELDEDGVLKMFAYLKTIKKNKMAKGNEIGKELMGGQPQSEPKPSGAILLEVRRNGKEIIVTEDGGKTKEKYVKSNGYSGYTLRYKGNEYEFTDTLMAKGGLLSGFNYSIGGL